MGKKYMENTTKILLRKAKDLDPGKSIPPLIADDGAYYLHVVPHLLNEDESKAKQIILVFFVVTLPAFKKYHDINDLMTSFQNRFKNNNEYTLIRKATNGSLTKRNQKNLQGILNVYGSSKLIQAHQQVEQVTTVVKESIALAVQNTSTLGEIDE